MKSYPDLIATLPRMRRRYIAARRRFMIAIYSRGLNGSHVLKLAEYIASSKCIVGEPWGGPSLIHWRKGATTLHFTGSMTVCSSSLSRRSH